MMGYRVKGYRAAGLASGIKPNGEKDIGIIISDTPAVTAGVFTRNEIQAAPVLLDCERISRGPCRAVIVNSGIANCCTGQKGMEDARTTTQLVADHLGFAPDQVLVASTGVIGQPLPMKTIKNAIPGLIDSAHPDGFSDFSKAIMTTDTVPKLVTRSGKINGQTFSVTGIAKGSGMIHPNMATMLAFICTDLAMSTDELQTVLKSGVDTTFNRITIDGDTSTNDTVLLFANGQSSATIKTDKDKELCQAAIHGVMASLAKRLVKDGEGATKLVTIEVTGASSDRSAKAVGNTVAQSSLVKTALFGEDANWGRIVAAVGRAGVPIKLECLKVFFEDNLVFESGKEVEGYDSNRADAILKQDEYTITIDLGMGSSKTSILTCDLSVEYVHINADYRS